MKKILYLSLAVLFAAGCCASSDKNACKKDAVVAKINNYEITAGDLKEEIKILSANNLLPKDPEQAKKRALDELIVKKMLLQEAQRQNFDKDKSFMKEIERYWEQALLKLLMKKKIDEFSAKMNLKVDNAKRREVLQKEIVNWEKDLRASSKITIDEDNLKKVEIPAKEPEANDGR